MKTFVLTLLAVLVAAPSLAYDITDLRRDAKARLDKMIAAVGDVTLEQEASFEVKGEGSGAMKSRVFMRGTKWRVEGEMSAGKKGQSIETVTLYDGSDLWTLTMGMKSKLPKSAMGQNMAPAFWNEPAEGAQVVGEETVSGRACWKVFFAGAKDIGATTTWFDKATFMPVQSESKLSGKTVRSVFSDFRKVKGYEVPHLTEVFSDGTKTMTSKIVKLETHTGLSDDLFDPDKLAGGAGMDMEAMMKQAEEMKKKMMEQQGGK